VLYFTLIQHLANLYAAEHIGIERFILLEGGVYTALFWLGQVFVGGILPMLLVFKPGRKDKQLSNSTAALASALVILGGFAQIYVIVIGGQAYPLNLFPGMDVSSSFNDGVIASYAPSLPEIGLGLGGVALADAGVAADVQAGADMIDEAVRSGAAAQAFQAMVAGQGGPVEFVERAARFLPEANVIREVVAEGPGCVTAMDGQALGRLVVALGGGRRVETDAINPAVGLSDVIRLGMRVERGTPLAVVHATRQKDADMAEAALRAAITIGTEASPPPPAIYERVG
jgi:hypothetical protein